MGMRNFEKLTRGYEGGGGRLAATVPDLPQNGDGVDVDVDVDDVVDVVVDVVDVVDVVILRCFFQF